MNGTLLTEKSKKMDNIMNGKCSERKTLLLEHYEQNVINGTL